MKQSIFFLAASFCLLAGCSQKEKDFADVNNFSEGDLVEKVIFEVLPIKDGDASETRASAVPDGGTVGFIWESTDTVGIYPDKGSQVYFNIEDGVGTSSVSFTGGGWALKQNSTYTSYYPFVGDIYLKRDKIPVSFAGQKQIGTTSPFVGARYYLATEASTSENGVLRFSYSTLNTIINVNATLPAGTYTKMSLTIEEPLFVEEGTYSLDERTIVGTKFTNKLEIELENVVLTEETTIPIYIMSAPVDLKGKEVTVKVISSDGNKYVCVKTPSNAYAAGTRYGLTCDEMEGMVDEQPNNVIYYTSSDGEIVSPSNRFGVSIISNEYVNGQGILTFDGDVTAIGNYAFMGKTNLTSIKIPNSVTSIGLFAFYGCTSLTNFYLPESVTTMGYGVFARCPSLVSFSGKYASLDGCFLIDSGILLAVAEGSIHGNITLPEGITSIGDDVFYNCESLTRINIPNSVTSIGAEVFWNCINLASVSIPSGLTQIKKSAFYGCTSLTNIRIPNSVSFIGIQAFTGCSSLSEVNIPEGITSLPRYLFSGCSSLTSITIPESVSVIENYVFSHCSNLKTITIPEMVTSIGISAFSGCSSMNHITMFPVTPPSGSTDMFIDTNECPIYVPSGSVDVYKAADYWSEYAARIHAKNDFAGPEIVSFTIEPSTIDVTEASQTVSFLAHVIDETGVDLNSDLEVCVYNPIQTVATVQYVDVELESGDAKDGYYKAVMTIDQGKAPGNWVVSFYGLKDLNGNTSTGQGVGRLEVINNAGNDVTGPEIVSFTIEPSTIDVTEASQTVSFLAHVIDETGVDLNSDLEVCVYNPIQTVATVQYVDVELESGDAKDGYYKAVMTIDQGKVPGNWVVSFYGLKDLNGNTSTGQGVGRLEVINNAGNDVTGPEIVSFTIEPSTIDVTEASQTVSFLAHVIDETGVDLNSDLEVCVYNPIQTVATVQYVDVELESGDAKDGYYKAVMTIDQGKAPGNWVVSFYGLKDLNGNTSTGQGVGRLEVINNN